MIIHRDNSPEQISDYEITLARSELVEASALEAQTALYSEFANAWAHQQEVAEAFNESFA